MTSSIHSAAITGLVVHGDGRGAALGFPTANLKLQNQHNLPADGVYACLTQILPEPAFYQSTLHIGPRPTFPHSSSSIEVHLINFPYQPLYGKKLYLRQFHRLRDIQEFPSQLDLIRAIKQDIINAKQLLLSYEEYTS